MRAAPARTAISSAPRRSPSSRRPPVPEDGQANCPVFVRFSTVAGGAGSVDTPRDVRGFAVKFYTDDGNWDLVGNNIPVFFIQDAIKFPDLVHAVKMEADRGYPQAAAAHDTFWDFIGADARDHPHDHVGDVRPHDPALAADDGGLRRPHLPLRQRQGRRHVRQIPLEAEAGPAVDAAGTRPSRSPAPTPTSIAATCSRRSTPATSRNGTSACRSSTRLRRRRSPTTCSMRPS